MKKKMKKMKKSTLNGMSIRWEESLINHQYVENPND